MRTPKRPRVADAAGDGSPTTPRSSKRLRAAATAAASTASPAAVTANADVNGQVTTKKTTTTTTTTTDSKTAKVKSEANGTSNAKATGTNAKATAKAQRETHGTAPVKAPVTAKPTKVKATAKAEPTSPSSRSASPDVKPSAPAKRPPPPANKKTKEAPALAPLAPRSTTTSLRLGAHVSAAGGVHFSVANALQIGANAFALFLKSQRKWTNPPLESTVRDLFVASCAHNHYDALRHVVPHGSYLVNLAQPDADKAKLSYDTFLDDLHRCDRLGIRLYNFHPGSTVGQPRAEALQRVADQLNRAHAATEQVVTLLENMAARGNTIGGTWRDLGEIVKAVQDKSRVGVCLDTCHAFAAGYDLRTAAGLTKVLDDIEAEVGVGMLRALHVNDSKAPLGSHRDLHANIGTGFLGLEAFHALVNEKRLWGLPMVLETPTSGGEEAGGAEDGPDAAADAGGAKAKGAATAKGKGKGNDNDKVQPAPPSAKKARSLTEDKSIWAREIKLLESLVGMDAQSAAFTQLATRLAAQGAGERARIQGQVDRSRAKSDKATSKSSAKDQGQATLAFGRKKKTQKGESEDDDADEDED